MLNAPAPSQLTLARHSSTNARSRSSARSHCSETNSRYSFISSIGRGSNSNKLSRPERTHRTIPTFSSTRRCFVIACRVNLEPAVSSVIDRGSPPHNFLTSESRVSSPSAANTGARARRPPLRADMAFDVLHLLSPSTIIHAERLSSPPTRKLVKTRFNHCQQRPVRRRLQSKLNQGWRLS
jgi:hypothetical protein